MPASRRDFDGSEAKAALRRQWDKPILLRASQGGKTLLSYFGLPGPAVEDLIEWRQVIGVATGVERLRRARDKRVEDLERHRRLMRNVLAEGLTDFQLLRGDIEDVILNACDQDRNVPKVNDGNEPHLMRFRYGLVNLDFLGGVGYRDKNGETKRVRALRKLFERQRGTSFVLLLTLNVRDTMDEEITTYLQRSSARQRAEVAPVLRWYAERGAGEREYKLKALVPLFIQSVAEGEMFSVRCYPPVAYTGSGRARLVHFVFELTHVAGSLQAFSDQSPADLLALPLCHVHVNSKNGDGGDCRIELALRQHYGFDTSSVEKLTFLPLTLLPVASELVKVG